MEVINLCEHDSLVSQYMLELRDKNIQTDRLRFRTNVKRLGQIMAYEISKRLQFADRDTVTPLEVAHTRTIADQVVLGTIFRAGLPLHEGLLSYFDNAENAFISAYREYVDGSDEFVIRTEYLASPSIGGKTLVIADPMLATGCSMEVAIQGFLQKGTPKHIHIAVVIATDQAIEYVKNHLPEGVDATIWAGDVDHVLNAHSYIVPGLGDAGDLLYGEK
ncbi:MAG: uracil phosphoribosyltransferase [Muribaculaceae bacterium]|nr:uracil phosphoribosyltransferase [Muribaculaceae bacterium]